MNDAGRVRLREGACGLPADLRDFARRQGVPLDDGVREGLPPQKLHDDVRQAVLADPVIVDVYRVRGLQARSCPRLDLEARARFGLLCELRLDALDGDACPERHVRTFPDGAHAARADEALD